MLEELGARKGRSLESVKSSYALSDNWQKIIKTFHFMEQQLLIESRTRRGKNSDLSPWKLVFREKLIKICVMNEREIETFVAFSSMIVAALWTRSWDCASKSSPFHSAPVYYFSFVVVQSSVESFPVFLFWWLHSEFSYDATSHQGAFSLCDAFPPFGNNSDIESLSKRLYCMKKFPFLFRERQRRRTISFVLRMQFCREIETISQLMLAREG